jgi:hypothetical protein
MKKAGEAITRTPSAAKIAIKFIWYLCSTAARIRPQDKENLGVPGAHLLFANRQRAGEGLDVGAANYKARLNLRVSLATAAKLRARKPKGNEAAFRGL